MPQLYKKKPVFIQAVQFTGTNQPEIERFVGEPIHDCPTVKWICVNTPSGLMAVLEGEFVIRYEDGELDSCSPSVFEAEFEPV